MKHLTIIIPLGQINLGTIACIAGVYEIFTTANGFNKKNGKKELFAIELAGISNKAEVYKNLFTVKPEVNISTITKTNLIIIPSTLIRSYKDAMKENGLLIDWIEKQYKEGAEVASMCSGAFLLASSGLLDGKNCSTHWAFADAFRTMFPKVNLQADQLITDESGIYTNGGAYSFLNLAIYLVEKYYDKQTAIYCSKMFQIEIERHSQSPFAIFSGQKKHPDDDILKAQLYIEKNYPEKISIEFLSNKFGIGRRNFDRRFIKATGITPLDYLQR